MEWLVCDFGQSDFYTYLAKTSNFRKKYTVCTTSSRVKICPIWALALTTGLVRTLSHPQAILKLQPPNSLDYRVCYEPHHFKNSNFTTYRGPFQNRSAHHCTHKQARTHARTRYKVSLLAG